VIAVLGVDFRGQTLGRYAVRPPQNLTADVQTSDIPLGYFADPAPDAIFLHPPLAQDVDDALTFRVALVPKPTVEHLPRIAEIKFYDAIADGFLSRMYMHPNKPYSAPALAMQKRKSFNHWIARYIAQAKQGYVGAQNWVYPPEWGVRRIGQAGGR
jgi:hypothetical protein